MNLSDFANSFLDFRDSLYILCRVDIFRFIFINCKYMDLFFVICFIGFIFLSIYAVVYIDLSRKISHSEDRVVDIFLEKISKIPAVIEVMRPHIVDDKKVFESITHLHSEAMIHEYGSIPMLMEQNVHINDQYWFLMRLSMAVPELQKNTYFIYIRDFVMSYDRMMKSELAVFNILVKKWNFFIKIKKWTIIGWVLPGKEKSEI